MMVLWCSNIQARPWSQEEIVLESVAMGLIAIDYAQTAKFTRNGIEEANPILGKKPTQSEIIRYGVMFSLAHIYLVDQYPEHSAFFQWEIIIIESYIVNRNNRVVPANARLKVGFTF